MCPLPRLSENLRLKKVGCSDAVQLNMAVRVENPAAQWLTPAAGKQYLPIPQRVNFRGIHQFALDHHLQQGSCQVFWGLKRSYKPEPIYQFSVQLSLAVQAVNKNELK